MVKKTNLFIMFFSITAKICNSVSSLAHQFEGVLIAKYLRKLCIIINFLLTRRDQSRHCIA